MTVIRARLILVTLLVAPLVAESAAPAPPAPAPGDLTALLEPILAGSHVPALGAAIVRAGDVTGLGVAGVRARGDEARVTVGDLWHLGSCTKAMTATLVARLVERGVLNWDATIGEVLGEVVEVHEGYRGATIRQLVQNIGGAPHDVEQGLWKRLWKCEGTPTEQRLALARGVLASAPAVEPGGEYLYSNAGFAIAGAMVEKITGEAWEELLAHEVFAPLGMASAGFGAPGTPERIDQPRGHVGGEESPPVPPGPAADNPPAIGPAGIVHASLRDWARFVACHLRGARGGATAAEDTAAALLTSESFAALHTPPAGSTYASGWGTTRRGWAKGRVLTHSGSNTMWYCVVWIAPERDLAVLVTCNQGGDEAAATCDQVAGALIHHALDR